jgi:glycosyltransferase involved in cell wall biosynthesis
MRIIFKMIGRRVANQRNIILVITALIMMTLIWLFISSMMLRVNKSKAAQARFNEELSRGQTPRVIPGSEKKKSTTETKKGPNTKKPLKKKIKKPLNVKSPIKIVDHDPPKSFSSTPESNSDSFESSFGQSYFSAKPIVNVDIIVATWIDNIPLQNTFKYFETQLCDNPKSSAFQLHVKLFVSSVRTAIIPKSYYCESFQVSMQTKYQPKKTRKSLVSDLELFNYGVSQSKGKYYFFLDRNSEVWAYDLYDMVAKLEADPKLSIIGSKVLTKKHDIISAGMDVGMKWDNIPVLYHRYVGYPEKYRDSDVSRNLLCVHTVGMLIRASAFVPFDLENGPIKSLTTVKSCLEQLKLGNSVFYEPKNLIVSKLIKGKTKYDGKIGLKQKAAYSTSYKTLLTPLINKRYELDPNLHVAYDYGAGSCTGFFIEATNIVTELEKRVPIKIITGKDDFCLGLPQASKDALHRMLSRDFSKNISIWISHKPPPSYPRFPYTGIATYDKEPDYIIGRSMYESTRIEKAWVSKANDLADEIWVPSKFLIKAFVDSGVDATKVRWMPEPIDVDFYNPKITPPLDLPDKNGYNFLSVFKWEDRKGPDLLFKAYFEEFKKSDPVTLHVLTYIYGGYDPHSKKEIRYEINKIAKENNFDMKNLPKVSIINKVVPTKDMPKLYKFADAFVLPTRAEGWGLPFMEAMTMELPTIGTAWGGQMDFMNEKNSYLIKVEEMEKMKHQPPEVEDDGAEPFRYARASVPHLRTLMRNLVDNPEKGLETGKRARQYIIDNFSQQKLGDMIVNRLKQVERIIIDQKKTKKRTRKLEAELKKSEGDGWQGFKYWDDWGKDEKKEEVKKVEKKDDKKEDKRSDSKPSEVQKPLEKSPEKNEKPANSQDLLAKKEVKKESPVVVAEKKVETGSAIGSTPSKSNGPIKPGEVKSAPAIPRTQLPVATPIVGSGSTKEVDVKKELETRSNLAFEDVVPVKKTKKEVKGSTLGSGSKKVSSSTKKVETKPKPQKKAKKPKKKTTRPKIDIVEEDDFENQLNGW